jgi:hypothetical protein
MIITKINKGKFDGEAGSITTIFVFALLEVVDRGGAVDVYYFAVWDLELSLTFAFELVAS